jgi:hypothetical protein
LSLRTVPPVPDGMACYGVLHKRHWYRDFIIIHPMQASAPKQVNAQRTRNQNREFEALQLEKSILDFGTVK